MSFALHFSLPLSRSHHISLLMHRYNRLVSLGRLEMLQRLKASPAGEMKEVPVWKFVSAKDAKKMAGLSASERMAYHLVKKSGSSGQTRKDIKFKTNIQNTAELKGIIDRLVARNLIKEIKSVLSANKRVFVLAELDASQTHGGGPWFGEDQEYDQTFIEVVYNFVLGYMGEFEGSLSLAQITEHIEEVGICTEKLSVEDVRQLMNVVMWDGEIEGWAEEHDSNEVDEAKKGKFEFYRIMPELPMVLAHVEQPCFKCPVKKDCFPGGTISPTKCVYGIDWLGTAVNEMW